MSSLSGTKKTWREERSSDGPLRVRRRVFFASMFPFCFFTLHAALLLLSNSTRSSVFRSSREGDEGEDDEAKQQQGERD